MGSRGAWLAGIAAVVMLFAASPASANETSHPCSLVAQEAALAIGAGPCPGVRPGSAVITGDSLCTQNFQFVGSGGARYVGTAGHCVLGRGPLIENMGEHTWAPGAGPVAQDSDRERIGTFVYAIEDLPYDFALIRLDPGVAADPQVCHFGGPTGLYAGQGDATVVQHVGQGMVVGDLLPARSGLSPGTSNDAQVFAVAATGPGDSGSPVTLPDGRAVGLVEGLGEGVFTIIPRLAPQVDRAESALGTTLTLQEAPTR
jgi:Trypsin-like peptidase domain